MKERGIVLKKVILCEMFISIGVSFAFVKIFPAIPDSKDLIEYEFNLFTISSVFAGFSFTTLGILLGMSSENIMQRLQNTTVITNKSKNIVMSLLFFCVSCFISLAFIIGCTGLVSGIFQKVIYYFGIITLLIGIVYFLLSVYEIYDLIRCVYGVNLKEVNKKKDKFEQELSKAKDRNSKV